MNVKEEFPSLVKLTVKKCPRLKNMPWFSSLQHLELRHCNEMILSLLENNPCLRANLSATRNSKPLLIGIFGDHNLASVLKELQHLTALEHLTIMYCPSLASLPANFRNFSMLKSLYILSCPELASLPEELQHVTSLQSLEIHSCPAFENLPGWIGNLSGLTSLALSDCQAIVSLPEGLHHLTSLQHLSIRECPRLEHRCKKNLGEDWWKIAHIPHIYIGSTAPKELQ
ncbi:hypothetical protein Patl1_26463 [Pistacia atlantica]|uniref:Uncharacterized protein n=1 Tax=Pistacia atlantica TaxID=434234 RepID=A0ACC1B2E8_9ROSI|nr:hypothetical protein Patl1_26463 [Pistacia atlantica]